MANSVTATNPRHHIIDTADAGLIVSVSTVIKRVRWTGATTAGHQAVIQDASNRVVWESVAPAANYVEVDEVMDLARGGYKVPTLGSGKLYIQTD